MSIGRLLMRRLGIAAILLAASLARAQGVDYWSNYQNTRGLAQVIPPGAGACFLYSSAPFDVQCYTSIPSTFVTGLFYQQWTDNTFTPLPQETFSTAGAGLSITDDPGDTATVISLPLLVTPGSCTNCSATFDNFGRATVYSSGTAASYQTIDNAGTPLTQRPAWNASTGLTAVDNSGANRTDVTANLSTGVSGGQTAIGGTASGNNLVLSSTSNATKGKTVFGSTSNAYYDEQNQQWVQGSATPISGLAFEILKNQPSEVDFFVGNSDASGSGFVSLRAGDDNADNTHKFIGMTILGTATNFGGLLTPQAALFECSPTNGADCIWSNRNTGDLVFATTISRTEVARVRNAGNFQFVNMAAPGTPGSGKTAAWTDSTSKNWAVKNDAGTVNHGAQTFTCSAHQFETALADTGASTCAALGPGDVTCASLPALTGDTHSSAGSCATVTDHLTDGTAVSFSTSGAFVAGQPLIATAGNHIATNAICSVIPGTTCGSTTSYGTSGSYLANVTVDSTLRVPSVTVTSTPLASALVYTLASSSLSMGQNQSTLVMPMPAGAPIINTAAAGVPLATTLSANWGSSSQSPPTFFAPIGSIKCTGDITFYSSSGGGQPVLVSAVWYVTGNAFLPGSWHSLASQSQTLNVGSGSGRATITLSASSTSGLVPSDASLVFVFYRSDAVAGTTLNTLNTQVVCSLGT